MSSSGVQVVVRLRPLNDREKKHGTLPVISASTKDKTVTVIRGTGSRQARASYSFDNVFTAFSTQEDVFDTTLKPMISDVLIGYESTGKNLIPLSFMEACIACIDIDLNLPPRELQFSLTAKRVQVNSGILPISSPLH